MLATVSPSILTLGGSLGDSSFEVTLHEQDVAEAIRRFDSVAKGVESLLKIGAAATLATSTGFDTRLVREEMDRAVERTIAGLQALENRVNDTIADNGPVAETLRRVGQNLATLLHEAMATQSDAQRPGTLLSKIEGAARTIDALLIDARRDIAEELRQTTERHSKVINNALQQMRDLDPSSAIGRAFANIDTALKDLTSALAASQAAAAERQRGTAKGKDYEELTAGEIADIAVAYADCAERTGTQGGLVITKQKPSLRGDVTCDVSDGGRVVVEAMDRDRAGLTRSAVVAELDEAMQNRGAQAAIAVLSAVDAPALCGQPLGVRLS